MEMYLSRVCPATRFVQSCPCAINCKTARPRYPNQFFVNMVWFDTRVLSSRVVKTHDDSVTILDISDPYAPAVTARVQNGQDGFEHLSGPKDLDVMSNAGGTYVLVPDYVDGYLNIIDITDPASPVMAGPESFELGSVADVSVISTGAGTYAVVTDVFADGIYVVDVTDPSSPEVLSSILSGPDRAWTLLGDEMELFTVDGRAYALLTAYVDDAVRVTDITDPYKPIPKYVIQDGQDGFDMGRPISVASGVVGDGMHAMISGFRDGVIQIVDMSDPEKPVPVSVIQGGNSGFEGFTGAGNVVMTEIDGTSYAVAAAFNEDAVHVFDISDPANPVMVATARDGQDGFELVGAEDISVVDIGDGTFAVVSSFRDSSIRVIDITDPATPRQASFVRGGMDGYDLLYHITDVDAITVGDASLMVAGTFLSDAVVVVDISDPYNPARLSSMHGHQDGGYMHAVQMVEMAVIGDRTYVAAASARDSVQFVDVTDPESPTLGGLISAGLEGTTIYGVRSAGVVHTDSATLALVMMDDENIVHIFDVSNPSSPVSTAVTPLALR